MIFELVRDFSAALAVMPEDHPKRRILASLERAIRRDTQFINRHPTTLFQCMWNTCWWYDSPAARTHYKLFLSSRATRRQRKRGSRLHEILEMWRQAKERATPGFRWVRCHRPPGLYLGDRQLSVLRGHDCPVISVGYSPNGKWLASGAGDGTVRVWDASSGAELGVLAGHEGAVNSVASSPDGGRIVSGSSDTTARVWDAEGGGVPHRLPPAPC